MLVSTPMACTELVDQQSLAMLDQLGVFGYTKTSGI